MAIHVTPIPRLTVLTTPAFTLGTTNTAGAAITAVSSNSTILTYDATDPESVAGAAVVGDATTAARRNHVHNVADISATQAEMETATSTTVFPTAATTQNHPGVAKAWVSITSTGALEAPDYNVASITDTGTGDRNVVFTTAMSSAVYATAGASLGDAVFIRITNRTTALFRIEVMNSGNTGKTDVATTHIVTGDQ